MRSRTPLYTVEPLYSNTLKQEHRCIQWNSNTLKWGHLCIQWNSSIPTPWNVDTSVYSGTPLFQHPEMWTPLYTVESVELLFFNTLKPPLTSGTVDWPFISMNTPKSISLCPTSCACCIDVTPTIFCRNHLTQSEPVNIRIPEVKTYT